MKLCQAPGCVFPLPKGKTKYCSKQCAYRASNVNYQSYQKQQQRGIARKVALIEARGKERGNSIGGCEAEGCEYRENLAALEIHHVNPLEKSFALDIRKLANMKLATAEEEFAKCEVLCGNCHAEKHNPNLRMTVRDGEVRSPLSRHMSSLNELPS